MSPEGGTRKECIIFSVFTEKKKIKYNVHFKVMGGGLAYFVFWWDECFEVFGYCVTKQAQLPSSFVQSIGKPVDLERKMRN